VKQNGVVVTTHSKLSFCWCFQPYCNGQVQGNAGYLTGCRRRIPRHIAMWITQNAFLLTAGNVNEFLGWSEMMSNRTISHPNGPCARSFILEMAGIEFMQQVVPRTAHEYTRHERKMADQRNKTLPRYSIMEVRRMEPPAQDGKRTTPGEGGTAD
jgi:hypothetical protein